MIFRILQLAIPFIWFGALGAISFMEAPLKFTAPNITLALGLGIGRIVFQTLNRIEIALAVLLVIAIVKHLPSGRAWLIPLGLIASLLLLETAWLLPALDARASLIIQGETPPPSTLHIFYVTFDAIKLVSLFVLGVNLAKQNLAYPIARS